MNSEAFKNLAEPSILEQNPFLIDEYFDKLEKMTLNSKMKQE